MCKNVQKHELFARFWLSAWLYVAKSNENVEFLRMECMSPKQAQTKQKQHRRRKTRQDPKIFHPRTLSLKNVKLTKNNGKTNIFDLIEKTLNNASKKYFFTRVFTSKTRFFIIFFIYFLQFSC